MEHETNNKLPDVTSDKVVLALHGYGELFLVVVEKVGVGYYDEGDLVS